MPIVIRNDRVGVTSTVTLHPTDLILSMRDSLESAPQEELNQIDEEMAARNQDELEEFDETLRYYYGSRVSSIIIPTSSCWRCGNRMENPDQFSQFRWDDDHVALICDNCWKQVNFTCSKCGKMTRQTWGVEGNPICKDCLKETKKCRHCGNHFYPNSPIWKEGVNGICRECTKGIRQYTGGVLCRMFGELEETPNTSGNIVKSLRPFGVELECFATAQKNLNELFLTLPPEVGTGTDGSIQGGMGIELRTPPMKGKKAEEIIYGTCKALQDQKLKVNSSCGFHIHIDVGDIDKHDAKESFHDVRDLWLFYMAFEDVILSFLHPNRRNNERYCRPLKADYSFKEIAEAPNTDRLEKIWYRESTLDLPSTRDVTRAKGEHRHVSRYRGINLHPLFSERHIEIRYHSGTTNLRKILEWAELHTRIVDTIFNRGLDDAWIDRMVDVTNLDHKTVEMFNYLDLSQSTRGYLRARQAAFYIAPKFSKDDLFKSGEAELKAEQES